MEQLNLVKEQDRARDMYCLWKSHGFVMFRQQKAIYNHLRGRLLSGTVLEAGCGSGQGQAILKQPRYNITATDKLEGNVRFCRELYPQDQFSIWDIGRPWPTTLKHTSVVAVEVIEHVQDWQLALKNLLDACTHELWISTPNGQGKPSPPSNPYHVREIPPKEFLNAFSQLPVTVEIFGWEHFEPLGVETEIDPLAYKVTKL